MCWTRVTSRSFPGTSGYFEGGRRATCLGRQDPREGGGGRRGSWGGPDLVKRWVTEQPPLRSRLESLSFPAMALASCAQGIGTRTSVDEDDCSVQRMYPFPPLQVRLPPLQRQLHHSFPSLNTHSKSTADKGRSSVCVSCRLRRGRDWETHSRRSCHRR